MNANEVWDAFLGEGNGLIFRSAIMTLAMIQPEAFDDAILKISRETTLGPMLNPTAYLGGARFENARDYADIIQAAAKLHATIRNCCGEGPERA